MENLMNQIWTSFLCLSIIIEICALWGYLQKFVDLPLPSAYSPWRTSWTKYEPHSYICQLLLKFVHFEDTYKSLSIFPYLLLVVHGEPHEPNIAVLVLELVYHGHVGVILLHFGLVQQTRLPAHDAVLATLHFIIFRIQKISIWKTLN